MGIREDMLRKKQPMPRPEPPVRDYDPGEDVETTEDMEEEQPEERPQPQRQPMPQKKEPKQETTQYDILDIWRQNMLLMRANRLQDILVIDRMIREIEEIKKHAPGVQ